MALSDKLAANVRKYLTLINKEKMNEVPIIRKGSIKDYLGNGFAGGLIIGILVFLFSLIKNNAFNAALFGLFTWIGILILFIGVGFTSEEYFKRKKRIKELCSPRYSFLDENNFKLHQDLYFEGEYKGYWFRVLPMVRPQKRGKELKYEVIESFYDFESEQQEEEKEKKMSGDYLLGKLYFNKHCAGFVPKDWENPDFKEIFDGLLAIFKRENLRPLLKKEWVDTYGKKLEEKKIDEEKSRTKQIIKIGKLNIKYMK